MDFHLILCDCALESQKKKKVWLVMYSFELQCKKKGDYFIFTEANCREK